MSDLSKILAKVTNLAAQVDALSKKIDSQGLAGAQAFYDVLGNALELAMSGKPQAQVASTSVAAAPEAAKPKKRKRFHDPNKPKRAPSGYLMFGDEYRRKKGESGSAKGSGMEEMCDIGKSWRALSNAERDEYKARAVPGQEKYKKALAEYEAANPEAVQAAKEDAAAKKMEKQQRQRKRAESMSEQSPGAEANTTAAKKTTMTEKVVAEANPEDSEPKKKKKKKKSKKSKKGKKGKKDKKKKRSSSSDA